MTELTHTSKTIIGQLELYEDRAKKLKEETNSKYVEQITNFILSDSDRSFLVPGDL